MTDILRRALRRIPYIRKADGWERAFGAWVVGGEGMDFWIVRTRGRAVRFLLWRCGIPKRLAFLGTERPDDIFDLVDFK